ncbi:MAG: hypothetical protein UMV23_04675, partial [Halanaerobium sp.]|nr:hypothetical protein [Halanaerobium sp.]
MTGKKLNGLSGIALFILGFFCPWLERGQDLWVETMVLIGGRQVGYLAGYQTTLGWFLALVMLIAISIRFKFIRRKLRLPELLIYRVRLLLGILSILLFAPFFYNYSLVAYGLLLSMGGAAIYFTRDV